MHLGVDAEVRGSLEVPRELPGFLLVFIAGYLVKIRRKTSLALIFSIGIIAFSSSLDCTKSNNFTIKSEDYIANSSKDPSER